MAFAKNFRSSKRPFAPTRGRKSFAKKSSTGYYDRQRKKTYGKYSSMTLYKNPRSQTSTTRYLTVVKYLQSQPVTDILNNNHADAGGSVYCLKSAIRAGDLVDCPMLEKYRYQFGGFRLEHVGASWTVSAPTAAGDEFAPIAYSSMLIQDFQDATGVAGDLTSTAWLAAHDRRLNNGTSAAEFHDKTAIDANINSKVHTLKASSTTISRFYKVGSRFDQRGSHSLSAAGSATEWKTGQAQELRAALDEQAKMSLIFFLPRAVVQAAVCCTFKLTFMGQPNFS